MLASLPGLAVRWSTYSAILMALGAVIFRVHVLRHAALNAETKARASNRARRIALVAAIALLPLALVRLALQTADMRFPDDPWAGVAARMVTETAWGTSWMAQVGIALALAAACVFARGGTLVRWMPASLLAFALAVTPTTSSHAMSADRFGNLPVLADVVHVFAASAWIGTLFIMLQSVRGRDASAGDSERYVPELLRVFSPLAMVSTALVVLTGLVSSFAHITTLTEFVSTRYGQTLLLKIASVAIVALFGWRNWKYLTPAIQQRGVTPIRRSIVMELLVAAVVLVVTAVLVVTPPPMEAMAMP